MKIGEDLNQRKGLGTRLKFTCTSSKCTRQDESFFTTENFAGKSSYKINIASNLAMRVIGKGRSAVLKLFSVLNLGFPVVKETWSGYTKTILEKSKIVSKFKGRYS